MTKIDPNSPATIGYISEAAESILDSVEVVRQELILKVEKSEENVKQELIQKIKKSEENVKKELIQKIMKSEENVKQELIQKIMKSEENVKKELRGEMRGMKEEIIDAMKVMHMQIMAALEKQNSDLQQTKDDVRKLKIKLMD